MVLELTKDGLSLELAIAGLSLVVALTSLAWTIWHSRKQFEKVLLMHNLTEISKLEKEIGLHPNVIRFLGVKENELKDGGLNQKEFGFLLSWFTVGGVWHRLNDDGKRLFKKGSYRWRMLESEHTQKAWPVIERFMNESAYKNKIRSTICEINKNKG